MDSKPDSDAAKGTLYLIITQVASRALTFAGNQFLLRYLAPEILGIAVQLELVSVSVLYFSRESIRVALQRQPGAIKRQDAEKKENKTETNASTQAAVNLSYLALLLGCVVALVFGGIYLWRADSAVLESSRFKTSFYLYALATSLELFAEPSFIVIQRYSLYADRARTETFAAIARCFTACFVAVTLHVQHSVATVLPFAAGQLAYGLILLLAYTRTAISVCRSEGFQLSLRSIGLSQAKDSMYFLSFFNKGMALLASTIYFQSIFKLILTQGDAMILSMVLSLSDQGSFALASNYGGLFARLIFQPIEESSRNVFGRLLGSASETEKGDDRGTEISRIREALENLSTILHFYLILLVLFFTIAPYLLPLLVQILIGTKWSNASTADLLANYCYCIPVMAINGILDAFVTSVASPHELRTQSLWMAFFTFLYGLLAWILFQMFDHGASGLVIANTFNLGLRAIWGLYFINRWLRANFQNQGTMLIKRTWAQSMLSSYTCMSAVAVALGLKTVLVRKVEEESNGGFEVYDLGYIVAGGAVLFGTILIYEQEFVLSLLKSFAPQLFTSGFISKKKSKSKNANTKS